MVEQQEVSVSLKAGSLEISLREPEIIQRPDAASPRIKVLHLENPSGNALPQLHDWYTRGDFLLADYPQDPSETFGMHLELLPVMSLEATVVQWVISVQTTLLDCHPMIDVVVPHRAVRHELDLPADPRVRFPPSMVVKASPALASPITIFEQASDRWLTVMLPPRDWPITGFRTTPTESKIRLFEEFLEKGVIRKATLWLMVTASAPDPAMIRECYGKLCEIPLPIDT